MAEKTVEELIEATRLGAATLDLANRGLTELPESLRGLKDLQSLNLADNELVTLPDWLGDFSSLGILNLSSNLLGALPASLRRLTNVRRLSLSSNPLLVLPDWVGDLTGLDSLELAEIQLTILPEWLGNLHDLKRLSLRENRLTGLPKSLSKLENLEALYLDGHPAALPAWLGALSNLKALSLSGTNLRVLPEWLSQLTNLERLYLNLNQLTGLPDWLCHLELLRVLHVGDNQLTALPESLGRLTSLRNVRLDGNQLATLPTSIGNLSNLERLTLGGNPWTPDFSAVVDRGISAVLAYLRQQAEASVVVQEAKLVLVGAGNVGKTWLLAALRGDPNPSGESTHGIEIKPVEVPHPEANGNITLNAWDFGGQEVYRPTHQLFFTAPAIYLVVWKPREGPQQGLVREWIQLIKSRAPGAKILVIATHGGPAQRRAEIDDQSLLAEFGGETILGFFHVDSDTAQGRAWIPELRAAIARLAAALPETKTLPSWVGARASLKARPEPYLPLDEVLAICAGHDLKGDAATLFLEASNHAGRVIHYGNEDGLRNFVILKPDWLAKAISYVLDDRKTEKAHGLASHRRLSELWLNPPPNEPAYEAKLHPLFVRLMEKVEISYEVEQVGGAASRPGEKASLIAQLVPKIRDDAQFARAWSPQPEEGDTEQVQICRTVDDRGRPAIAEGLLYRLIVRLHEYSLGRKDFDASVHWQRGLVLDGDFRGRAFLEQRENDLIIRVRAPYPTMFLSRLTDEAVALVEGFWPGLKCQRLVPCVTPCDLQAPGSALFEVEKLVKLRRIGRTEVDCTNSTCVGRQEIDRLLQNAPAGQRARVEELVAEELIPKLDELLARTGATDAQLRAIGAGQARIEDAFRGFQRDFNDPAREGPRLFTARFVNPTFLQKPDWLVAHLRVTLYCEHRRIPVFAYEDHPSTKGVYDLEVPRDWLRRALPSLKIIAGAVSIIAPAAFAAVKVDAPDLAKAMVDELAFAREGVGSLTKVSEKLGDAGNDRALPSPDDERPMEATGAVLRQLHALIKAKDPSFGGLERVKNSSGDYLWVHPRFRGEY